MPRKGELLSDLAGKRFGMLTVVRLYGRQRRQAVWECSCDCGSKVLALANNLKASNTRSCGCLRKRVNREIWTKHGHAARNTPEYESWCAMWSRVSAKSGRRFEGYGARGITACERWRSFSAFLEDMGPRPAGMSLDRIDNDGNYEPGNCRWATASQQNANKRRRVQQRSA